MIKFAGGKYIDGKFAFWERWDIRELEAGIGFYWFDTIIPVPINLDELVLLLPTPVISLN